MDDRATGSPLNLHLQQLAYLAEAARAGTLTAAAERLGISQPALSQALAEVERRLGVPLFERSGRRRVLTEAGREAVAFAEEVLARAAGLERWLERHAAGEAGRLRAGMIDAANLYLLPGAIRDFREAHPGVALTVAVDASGALMERVLRFDLDLAIVVGPPAEGLEAQTLGFEPLYLYSGADGTAGGALDDAEWALYPPGSRTRSAIDAGLAALGVTPRVSVESGNPQILRQVVALGLGRSVLPSAVAEAGERLSRAHAQPVAWREIVTVRRADAPDDAAASAFLALAAEEARVHLDARPAAAERATG